MIEKLRAVYPVEEIDAATARQWYAAHGHQIDPAMRETAVYAVRTTSGEIAGIAVVVLGAYNIRLGRTCDTLSSVLVDPRLQGAGYGSALIEWIVPRYSELALSVLRDNATAIRLYEANDFRIVGDTDGTRLLMLHVAAERAAVQEDLFGPPTSKHGYGYISAAPLLERASMLRGLAERAGILRPLPSEKIHATIMYDRDNPVRYSGWQRGREFDVTIIGHEVLQAGEGRRALAVTLQSGDLRLYHQELERAGFQHAHKPYLPHITLRYHPRAKDIEALAENFHLFRGLSFKLFERPWKEIKA